MAQILAIAGAVGQGNVDLAAPFAEWKVVFAVKGNGEHGRIAFENGGSPITLVHVEIEDGGAGGETLAAQGEDGDRQIVEDAESRTLVAEGVMGAAGQVAAETALHGIVRGGQGASYGGEGAAHEFRRPGKADAAHDAVVDRAV